jgi:hypothetical protein
MSDLTVELQRIAQTISRTRLPLARESATQSALAVAFARAGIRFEREVSLNAADRVDFIVSDWIAVEVKVKGSRTSIYRQCVRYCLHERVLALILASNVAMGLPPLIEGKPARLVNLGRAWL